MAAPVFVKVERYKRVNGVLERIRKRLDDAKAVLARIDELSAEEERELSAWKTEFSKIESRIHMVEDALQHNEK